MYNYMVLNVSERKLHKDFMSYYKLTPCDEFYFVSINDPKFLRYLEEFLERRIN